MVARQDDFNARVNLLMSTEVGYLHYIQDHRLRELLYPWLGDYAQLLPSRPHKISMGCEHGVVISIAEVKFAFIQGGDLS